MLFSLAGLAAGCVSFDRPDEFGSVDPAGRMNAAAQAARERDTAAVRPLIEMLRSDDPAERLLAIATLERLTGTRLGYDPTAPDSFREAAIDRWEDWIAALPAMPDGPATVPPSQDRP